MWDALRQPRPVCLQQDGQALLRQGVQARLTWADRHRQRHPAARPRACSQGQLPKLPPKTPSKPTPAPKGAVLIQLAVASVI